MDYVRDNLSDPFIILFGNKADLPREKWEVTSEEINDFSKKNGLACFETSAKTKMGIMEGISYMANEIYDKIINKYKKNIIIEERIQKSIIIKNLIVLKLNKKNKNKYN